MGNLDKPRAQDALQGACENDSRYVCYYVARSYLGFNGTVLVGFEPRWPWILSRPKVAESGCPSQWVYRGGATIALHGEIVMVRPQQTGRSSISGIHSLNCTIQEV